MMLEAFRRWSSAYEVVQSVSSVKQRTFWRNSLIQSMVSSGINGQHGAIKPCCKKKKKTTTTHFEGKNEADLVANTASWAPPIPAAVIGEGRAPQLRIGCRDTQVPQVSVGCWRMSASVPGAGGCELLLSPSCSTIITLFYGSLIWGAEHLWNSLNK